MRRPGNEVRSQPLRFAGALDVAHPREDLAEHDFDLHPRDIRTEAEVRTAGTESDVLARATRDQQPWRIYNTEGKENTKRRRAKINR